MDDQGRIDGGVTSRFIPTASEWKVISVQVSEAMRVQIEAIRNVMTAQEALEKANERWLLALEGQKAAINGLLEAGSFAPEEDPSTKEEGWKPGPPRPIKD